ncbi:hypothetical protein DS909_06675 [Phaeobacter gallaeciensis]|uniref:Uncharacterized protein n=1 Tax=Phaeobacter gallaeciensis TaxID=60890 RepID=A0A366X817_9RHOB|nr:hypothetical protein [Phaeobacter gallaeciensis]RBW58427.1 hypothetical protein DS909_06675 [Phaeobacter gallaeciensis]
MGMQGQVLCANAPAAHFDAEPFHVIAEPELAAQPLVAVGVCLDPFCSAKFVPSRPWQRYCSAACRKRDEAEFRRIGQKAAPALLAWQMGRYARPGPLADLSRVGRNYYSRLAADWLRDRRARSNQQGAQNGC